ncbi:hypothetical protein NC651_038540 [Populus alba x Populus x berolinensis]|nr:hypothetical protein NC651_038540 [Populus alba x Populus x berolinensis]
MHQGPEVCISGVKFLSKCMKTLEAKEHMIVAANNILKRCLRKQGGFPSLYRSLAMYCGTASQTATSQLSSSNSWKTPYAGCSVSCRVC